MIDNYSRVRLLTDRFQLEGAVKDACGYVIEVYDNGDCEVEFSDRAGISYAQIVARQDELEMAESGRIDQNSPTLTIMETTFGPISPRNKQKIKVTSSKEQQ